MTSINIMSEKCVGCKKCVGACPFGAIEVVERKAIIGEKCTLCGVCSDICKFEAINFVKDEVEKRDLSEYEGIWVFAEQRHGKLKSVAIELTGKARILADDLKTHVTAVVLGSEIQHLSKELIPFGADEVVLMDAPWLKDFNDHVYGEVMVDLIKKYKPEIVLIGATSNGRSLAPHISSTLETGLTADCTVLEASVEERLLLQTRPAFGGNLMATIVCPNHRPQMATVRPKVFKPMEPDYNRRGKVTLLDAPEPIDALVKKIRDWESDEKVNLIDADIIVGVGRGIGSQKNIQLAQELADALGGALGASRPVVDSGWLPYSQQVGQTGKTVAPKLYIACGISGAIQHLAGLAEIETVVAINSDPDAPIFQVANYCIVGDVKGILPLITEEIKKSKTT